MGISIWQLLIVMVIVLLLFGTRKLRNIGADLGAAIKSFKNALSEDESREKPGIHPDQLEATKEAGRGFEAKPEHPQRRPLEPSPNQKEGADPSDV